MTNTVMLGDKRICYTENFWTGKRTISIDGKVLQKIDKKTYKYEDKYYTIKGSYFTGVEISDGVQRVELVRKLTTLEMILCFIPFVVVVTGGAIGGLCGGAAWAFNTAYFRKTDKIAMKVLCSILSTVVAFVCYLILSSLFLGLFGA
ncbi:MAG: hypothetical protein IKM40_04170 [Clostridia bacterium]|nr:hypothetical protein [Clostridia bacterium]